LTESRDEEIWILGSKSKNADKSITWNGEFPNFNDCDILIVNLQSLDERVLKRIDKSEYENAIHTIFNKFVNGGKIIFITAPLKYEKAEADNSKTRIYKAPSLTPQYSNYFLSPIEFQIENVPTGNKLIDKKNPTFSPYVLRLKKFVYYLHTFVISQSFKTIRATNDGTRSIVNYLKLKDHRIQRY
jgi:hypothetical protein